MLKARTTLPPARMTPWGKNRAERIETENVLPESSDVVIIGGGASGVMAAWFLQKKGLSVTICEKGEIAAESSSRAFGWISGLLLDPSKAELSRQSLELWTQIHQECDDTGLRTDGICYFAENADEMALYESWAQDMRETGYPGIELLSASQLARRYPNSKTRFGGIIGNNDASLEPKIAIPTVAKTLMTHGVKILQQCAVRGLETTSGKVSGVVTEHGTIKARTVVLAGNLWTRLFCGNLGINIPQLYAIMSMGASSEVQNGPIGNGGQIDFAWRRQIDGAYSLGRLRDQRIPVTRDLIKLFPKFIPIMKTEAQNVKQSFNSDMWKDHFWPRKWSLNKPTVFEKQRIYDPIVDDMPPQTSLILNKEHFQSFSHAQLSETWSGAVTITPDNVPIASAVDKIPGFYVLTGCSYGLTWSPALGRMISDLVTGDTPRLDPTPYRLSRFFDGTPLQVRM